MHQAVQFARWGNKSGTTWNKQATRKAAVVKKVLQPITDKCVLCKHIYSVCNLKLALMTMSILGKLHRLTKTQIGHARDFTWYRSQRPSPARVILSHERVQIHACKNLCSYATNPPHFCVKELLLCDILITRAGDGRWPRYQAKSLACPGCGKLTCRPDYAVCACTLTNRCTGTRAQKLQDYIGSSLPTWDHTHCTCLSVRKDSGSKFNATRTMLFRSYIYTQVNKYYFIQGSIHTFRGKLFKMPQCLIPMLLSFSQPLIDYIVLKCRRKTPARKLVKTYLGFFSITKPNLHLQMHNIMNGNENILPKAFLGANLFNYLAKT